MMNHKELHMTRTKLLFSILLAAIFLTAQVAAVGAAPLGQETTPISGTVESISIETNPDTNETTVVVVINDGSDVTQTLNLSLAEAENLELIKDDGTGTMVTDDTKIGTDIEIDPSSITVEEEQKEHPVGSALGDFFSGILGVDYDMVMEAHEEGTGFGVIAQALWMSNSLGGDAETFSAILEAKETKDFSSIELPDGSTPQNWGQFRKAVSAASGDADTKKKAKENLGAIMSGRADNGLNEDGTEVSETVENGDEGSQITGSSGVLGQGGAGPDKNNNGKDNNKNDKSNNGKKPDKNKDKGKGKNK